MNCVRFANVINHATIINIFSKDNSNVTKIKTQTVIFLQQLQTKSWNLNPGLKNQLWQTIHFLLL